MTTINGRTPEEIKKGLGCDGTGDCTNTICPYFPEKDCLRSRHFDAFTLINQLQEDKKQLERERDAAVADLTTVCETVNTCLVCDHYRTDWQKPGCELNGLHCAWKWRGIKEK